MRSQFSKNKLPLQLPIITVLLVVLGLTAVIKSRFVTHKDQRSFFVRKVIDGDTIILSNGEKVRYIGIDTPETRKKDSYGNWVYDPEPFAIEATERNKELVLGKTVRLEFDVQKRDKYGRLLAYVFVNNIFINAALLEEGLAKILTIPPDTKYTEKFKNLQNDARTKKRGLWQQH